MFLRLLVLSTVCIVPIISTSDFDSTLPFGDLSGSELFSSNPALSPSDQSTSLFAPAQPFENSDAFLDTSSSLSPTTDNNIFTADNIGLDGLDLISTDAEPISDSFDDIVDCSTSTLLSPIGKLRRDNSRSCKNPMRGAANLNPSIFGDSIDLRTDRLLKEAMTHEEYNPFCYWITVGALPVGVCSSPDPKDTFPNGFTLSLPGVSSFELFTLLHSTLAAGFQISCENELYCCRDYYYDGEGANCVSLVGLRRGHPNPDATFSTER